QSERNMRARLNVDLRPLLRDILVWNYHDESEYPNGISANNLKPLPTEYSSVLSYQEYMGPLLILEAWQGLQRSKQELAERPFRASITNRATVDDFIDVTLTVDLDTYSNLFLNDGDLVLLSYYTPSDAPPGSKALMPKKDAPSCLAKVVELKRFPDRLTTTVRTYCPSTMMKHLLPTTELHLLRIMPLVSIEREYGSLYALPFYELCNSVLQGRSSVKIRPDERQINALCKVHRCNEPQAAAVFAALNSSGFTLIQGPPGTGKTKTILSIVGSLLTAQSKGKSIAIAGARKVSSADEKTAQKSKKRILICAPSNAAVDELVVRLKNGLTSTAGQSISPRIVRLGRDEVVNSAVIDVTLQSLVESKLQGDNEAASIGSGADNDLRKQLDILGSERNRVRDMLDSDLRLSADDRAKLEEQLDDLNRTRRKLGRELDEQREKKKTTNRQNEIQRKMLQKEILEESDIICATLSGSAHDILKSISPVFETVIIDEACQCIELSTLIPLRFGCTRCILVGDPNQLPPTVLSKAAARFNYERSLFSRIMNQNPSAVNMLSIQYRMHPAISVFPSRMFYEGNLSDGPDMVNSTTVPWHNTTIFGPYIFFDVKGQEIVSKRTMSVYNPTETAFITDLYDKLTRRYSNINFTGKIGIVTPYKQQLIELKNAFTRLYGKMVLQAIDFNTIDGFQGQEKAIVILSCVRSRGQKPSDSQSIGFLSDLRRMNVSLTRARSSLWIVGDAEHLGNSGVEVWLGLVEDAKRRGLVYEG
ncbi:hypothetical protein CANCADRAFT_12256, partial [Tortispora caseinolytica NRRL Y-17796]